MDFESAQKFLEDFVSYESLEKIPYSEERFDLGRLRRFLVESGLDLSGMRIVQVAGSKGKGTVSNLMAEYLWRRGESVGLYTSPHFVDLRERFVVNGEMISEEGFAGAVEWLSEFDLKGLTYFDLLTMLALKLFVDAGVRFVVLEVGLGGRLDSTSVVEPELGVLVRVEEEHLGVLGNNVEEILGEKLGILKEGMKFVVGPQREDVLEMIEGRLAERDEVYYVDEDGDALVQNAATARTALKVLEIYDELLFELVLAGFKLVGRFDVREVEGKQVVFDMAHTVDSVSGLMKRLKEKFPEQTLVFLVGILKDKKVEEILKVIDGEAEKMIFVKAHEERGVEPEKLAEIVDGEVFADVQEAFDSALETLKKDQVLVVTGSHFLVAKILTAIKQ